MQQFAALALLLATAAGAAWYLRKNVRGHERPTGTQRRSDRYCRWIARAALLFLGIPLAGLALLGRIDTLWHFPPEFEPTVRQLVGGTASAQEIGTLLPILVGAMLGGGLTGGIVAALRKSRKPFTLGKIGSLLPRNRTELAYAAALSVNAGVTEEVFFRLYLPLLAVLAGAPPLAAFAAAALLFGAAHFYQGWAGVLATTVVGGVMTFVYLWSGALWVPVLLHVLLDLIGLVLRPAMAGVWREPGNGSI
ncbi:MAG: CPBP family intramembrane glutamic endopeptidase [Pseudomonadota bacterium]